MRKYFSSRRINESLLQITDCFGFRANLVVGREKALLFDTMCGIGDVKTYAESVTGLPITVVLSHGHFDHIGGAGLFEKVWIHPAEMGTLRICTEKDHCVSVMEEKVRQWKGEQGFEEVPGERHGFRSVEHLKPEFLREGQIFSLGNLELEVVMLPGHTEGSVGLYCRQKRFFLTGDAVTPIMCLFFESSSFVQYGETLKKLMSMDFTYFVTSHHGRRFPKEILKEFEQCLEFSRKDRGLKFQYEILPRYRSRFHIYKGSNSDDDDFIGLIGEFAGEG